VELRVVLAELVGKSLAPVEQGSRLEVSALRRSQQRRSARSERARGRVRCLQQLEQMPKKTCDPRQVTETALALTTRAAPEVQAPRCYRRHRAPTPKKMCARPRETGTALASTATVEARLPDVETPQDGAAEAEAGRWQSRLCPWQRGC
jgi:hypothetical protein